MFWCTGRGGPATRGRWFAADRLPAAALLAVLAAFLDVSPARATNVEIVGTYSYQLSTSSASVQLSVAEILNPSSTYHTGTLRLELWLTTSPYSGGSINGFRVAAIQLTGSSNGTLGPDQYFSNVYATGPLVNFPSSGTYYVTFIIEEFTQNCGSSDGFCIDTFGGFGDQLVIGGSVMTSNAGPSLVAAVLPSSRSVAVGSTATAFATLINSGSAPATGCAISPGTSIAAQFTYQTTNPATNALTGAPNTPVSINPGAAQTFVVALTPTAPFAPTTVGLIFACANATAAPSQAGVNTLLLSASQTPVPDVVALAATTTNDGTVHIPSAGTSGAFAVATVNVGASGTITATANTGAATLPLSLSVCQTNAQGNCLAAPSPSVSFAMNAGATPTVAVFAAASGPIAFDPVNNRVFVTFSDATAERGSTSVAVETDAGANEGIGAGLDPGFANSEGGVCTNLVNQANSYGVPNQLPEYYGAACIENLIAKENPNTLAQEANQSLQAAQQYVASYSTDCMQNVANAKALFSNAPAIATDPGYNAVISQIVSQILPPQQPVATVAPYGAIYLDCQVAPAN